MAVPADFEAVVARRTDRTVFKGELNPIFQGIYSSRIELKNWMRVMERQLLTAEKLSTIAAWLGSPADPGAILGTWEPVLFNQTHDLASGVMTDHVYEDTIRSYEYAKRRSDEIIDSRWEVLAARIDTRGPGSPVVVFNPLGWPRSDIAEVEVGFDEGGVAGVDVTGPGGQHEPVQILESTRYADGGLKTARVAFVARDVPAMGYATYHVAPSRGCREASIACCEGRRRAGERPLPPHPQFLDGSDHGPAGQVRRLGRARRARQRRGTASRTEATSGSLTRAWTAAAGSP